MKDEAVFDELVEAAVLTETETETGEIAVADGFEATVADVQTHVETSSDGVLRDELREVGTPSEYVDRLVEVADSAPAFLARYLAVRRAVAGFDFETAIRITLLVEEFETPTLPTDGAPDGFLSVRGESLPTLLTIFPVAVVYVWREDCPECDLVRDDLEILFSDPPADVSLFSVYGPDCAAFLEAEYDVVGGPTTLFVVDGRVDSRLQGAHFREILQNEIREMRRTAEAVGVL
jgi:hypothetical protein